MFKTTANELFIGTIIIFLSFNFCSCTSEIPGLSVSERKMADSLYREEMKTFRKEMDSICLIRQDSLIPFYVDSMKKLRIKEIEIQLERVKNLK